jgi:hypothetical protein
MRHTKLLTLAVAIFASYSYANSLADETPGKWGTATNGLQMAICPLQAVWSSTDDPEFEIAFRNIGPKDVVLNLGITLASGRQNFATAVRLVLVEGQGFRKEYGVQGPVFVAGRIDEYLVVLQSGAVHTLRLKLSQCLVPQAKEEGIKLRQAEGSLQGHYRIAASFGTLESNYADFTIAPQWPRLSPQNDAIMLPEPEHSQLPATAR